MEDGLETLHREISLKDMVGLIERTACWVDPATFALLPVWYPEYARGKSYYNADWSEPRYRTLRASGERYQKVEGNVYANKALCLALGISKFERTNWSCCHIWGLDDPKFQKANTVVSDQHD